VLLLILSGLHTGIFLSQVFYSRLALLAVYLFGFHIDLEGGSNMFLKNIGELLLECITEDSTLHFQKYLFQQWFTMCRSSINIE
jgi:hypothetical protein